MKTMLELEERDHVNLEGILTWAFEFEDQPYFAGFRTLATGGIDKPVLNVFRMAGRMGGERIGVQSQGAVSVDSILAGGIRQKPAVDALATLSAHKVSVMVWNYQDDDVSAPDAQVDLTISGLPTNAKVLILTHYRIDRDHSNAFTAWKQMGSPQSPSAEEYSKLEAAGQLQVLEAPRPVNNRASTAQMKFSLPLQAISLIEVSWQLVL
jgi:xylan 1,4-beta-xylosidase